MCVSGRHHLCGSTSHRAWETWRQQETDAGSILPLPVPGHPRGTGWPCSPTSHSPFLPHCPPIPAPHYTREASSPSQGRPTPCNKPLLPSPHRVLVLTQAPSTNRHQITICPAVGAPQLRPERVLSTGSRRCPECVDSGSCSSCEPSTPRCCSQCCYWAALMLPHSSGSASSPPPKSFLGTPTSASIPSLFLSLSIANLGTKRRPRCKETQSKGVAHLLSCHRGAEGRPHKREGWQACAGCVTKPTACPELLSIPSSSASPTRRTGCREGRGLLASTTPQSKRNFKDGQDPPKGRERGLPGP